MAQIKRGLDAIHAKPKDCTFCVQFLIAGEAFLSHEFRVVTTFSQLPESERQKRLYKRSDKFEVLVETNTQR